MNLRTDLDELLDRPEAKLDGSPELELDASGARTPQTLEERHKRSAVLVAHNSEHPAIASISGRDIEIPAAKLSTLVRQTGAATAAAHGCRDGDQNIHQRLVVAGLDSLELLERLMRDVLAPFNPRLQVYRPDRMWTFSAACADAPDVDAAAAALIAAAPAALVWESNVVAVAPDTGKRTLHLNFVVALAAAANVADLEASAARFNRCFRGTVELLPGAHLTLALPPNPLPQPLSRPRNQEIL